jgi:hypothetical protein
MSTVINLYRMALKLKINNYLAISCNILFQSSLLGSMMYFQLTQIQIKVAIGPKYSPPSLDESKYRAAGLLAVIEIGL